MSVTAAVLGLALAIALAGIAAAATGAARAAEPSDARDAAPATPRQSDPSTQGFVRTASALTDRQRAAIRRLEVAARNLRRAVDELPDAKGGFDGGLIGLRRADESASRSPAIAAWLEDWSEHQDRDPDHDHRIGDWIPAQRAHIIGGERAEAALKASRLRRWPLPA